MEGFAWGVLAGAAVGNCGLQVWGALRAGMRFSPVVNLGHPDLRRYLSLTLPLMVGLTMTFATEIFLKFFGSFLAPGAIAALNYGLRVVLMIAGFGGQALGMAAFPFLARLVAEKRDEQMNQLLFTALRYLAIVIPLAALVMVLRREVILILFERGRFDAEATALCAQVLAYLLPGPVAFAAQTVVVRGFYARQQTLYPTVWASASVVMSIPFFFLGTRLAGVSGLALALAFSALLQVVLLFGLYCRRQAPGQAGPVYRAYGKMIAAAMAAGLAAAAVKRLVFAEPTTFGQALGVCAAVTAVFAPAILLAGRLLNVAELGRVYERLKAAVPKRAKP
jgi:putative peptidoglycan lipid II flippase